MLGHAHDRVRTELAVVHSRYSTYIRVARYGCLRSCDRNQSVGAPHIWNLDSGALQVLANDERSGRAEYRYERRTHRAVRVVSGGLRTLNRSKSFLGSLFSSHPQLPGAAQGRPEEAELSYRSSMGLAQGSYPPPPCAGSRCNAASSDVIRSRASSWACSKVCIIASCSNCRRSFRPLSPAPSGRGRAAAGKARHPGLAPAAPAGGLRQFGIVVLVEELRRLVEVPVARGAGRGLRADRRLLPAHRLRRARRRYPGGGAPPAHGGPPSDRRVRLAHLS